MPFACSSNEEARFPLGWDSLLNSCEMALYTAFVPPDQGFATPLAALREQAAVSHVLSASALYEPTRQASSPPREWYFETNTEVGVVRASLNGGAWVITEAIICSL